MLLRTEHAICGRRLAADQPTNDTVTGGATYGPSALDFPIAGGRVSTPIAKFRDDGVRDRSLGDTSPTLTAIPTRGDRSQACLTSRSCRHTRAELPFVRGLRPRPHVRAA